MEYRDSAGYIIKPEHVTRSRHLRKKHYPFTTVSIKQIAVAMLASMGFAAIAAPVNPDNCTHPVRVACVGDSITFGCGAGPGMSYPSQLQSFLGGKWDVKNFGLIGRTLLKKGDNPYWIEDAFKGAQEKKLGVIDMHGALEFKSELLPDHVTNTTGTGVMAATAYKALTGQTYMAPVTVESTKQ